MRIEFVTDTFPPDVNGVAMTLGRFVTGLKQRGHTVHVYHTADRNECEGETLLPSIPLPGYREVRIGLPGRGKLFSNWKRNRPDVVYVATESLLGLSAVKAATALEIPVAAGFHTNFDQYLKTYKLKGFKTTALAYLKRFHNKATCTFAPSPEVVERLKREGFSKVHLLGRGVDTELFSPYHRSSILREQWGVGKEDLVCLYVGRISIEKNIALSIRAYRKMQKKFPRVKMVVVGAGPELDSLKRNYPEVFFVGVKRGIELATHYASADVLLFASETETFGNVVIEAMASGIITLSYDYAASQCHVHDSINGYKVALGDEKAFQNKALSLCNQINHKPVREKARQTSEKLSWGAVITKFEVCLRLLSNQKMKEI